MFNDMRGDQMTTSMEVAPVRHVMQRALDTLAAERRLPVIG
jgi:hypothetical protein